MNILNYIKKTTKIAIDSADINLIKKYKFDSLTTNPTLIIKSLLNNSYNKEFINFIIKNNKKKLLDSNQEISIYDKLLVFIIGNLIPYINDKISMEIPARISYDFKKIIFYSKKLINLCCQMGIDNSKILVKIPATDSGIKAAYKLKQIGINSNLTLIFDMNQVKKCFDFGIYLISPFIGRISDSIKCYYDSGINFINNIIFYKKKYNYKTIIMGASFRNLNQIINSLNCDYLTISPNYFDNLIKNKINFNISKVNNKNEYKLSFLNKVSNNLLQNGIFQFNKDHNRLINIISNIISNL